MIIVGLCFDGGKSRSSKFFQNKYLQFLGRISMALYLIHTPLIYWIKIALQGEIGLAVVGKNPEVEFPAWPAIPLHILVFIHHMFSQILYISYSFSSSNTQYFVCLLFECFFQIKVSNQYQNTPKMPI